VTPNLEFKITIFFNVKYLGKKRMILRLLVVTQYQRATDGRTDGHAAHS